MYKLPGTNEKDVIKNMRFTRSIEKKDFFNRVIKSQSLIDYLLEINWEPNDIEKACLINESCLPLSEKRDLYMELLTEHWDNEAPIHNQILAFLYHHDNYVSGHELSENHPCYEERMKVDSAFIARWYENYESFIYKHAYMPINLDTKDIVMVLPYCDSVNKVDIKESTYGIVVSAKRTWEEGSKDSLVAAIEGWGYEEWTDGGTVSVLIVNKDGAIDVKKIKPTFIEKIKKDQILLGKFQEYLLEFQLYFSIMCNMICNNEDRNIEHMAYRLADLFKKRDEYVGVVKEEDYLRELNIPMKLGIDIDDEPYENDDDNLPFN